MKTFPSSSTLEQKPGLLGLTSEQDKGISGFLYIHADFWITPMFFMHVRVKHPVDSLWLVRWGPGSGKDQQSIEQMHKYWCGPWNVPLYRTLQKKYSEKRLGLPLENYSVSTAG